MNKARIWTGSVAGALLFCVGGWVSYDMKKSDGLPDRVKDVIKEVQFAQTAYGDVQKELNSLIRNLVSAETESQLAEVRAEFGRNMTNLVDSLKVQSRLIGVGQSANEVRTLTGVNAKSVVSRTEDLAKSLLQQSEKLPQPDMDKRTYGQELANVTNKMAQTFSGSKARQETALAGMLRENLDDKTLKAIAAALPDEWKNVGKVASLPKETVKEKLKTDERAEKAASAEVPKPANPIAANNGENGKPAGGVPGQGPGGAQAPAASAAPSAIPMVGAAASRVGAMPSLVVYSPSGQSASAAESLLRTDGMDELLMYYRDLHLPQDGESSGEIWNKMRWMLKMGFDGHALECLDGLRSAYIDESGENELDSSTQVMMDSAEAFIREMHDLKVSGGLMVSSVLKQDVAEADESAGRESYRVGDIITSVGTNSCHSIDDLRLNYAAGAPVRLYFLQDDGTLETMVLEASGQDLDEVYQFKEMTK